MMKKLLPLTVLALGLSSGVALADRRVEHRGATEHRAAPHSTVVVRDHGNFRGGNFHNNAIVVRNGGWDRGRGNYGRGNYGRGYYGGGARLVVNRPGFGRRPIFVSRPVIREHYFNYYRRPSILIENYGPRAGYFWVGGAWDWNGGEWIWTPGHYQPDDSYVDPGYDY
jgi:hypothetical protein